MVVSENVCVVVCLLYVCCRRLRVLRVVRDPERACEEGGKEEDAEGKMVPGRKKKGSRRKGRRD